MDLLRQVGLAARRSDGDAPGLLRADIPAVIRAVAKQLRSRSAKTKARSILGGGEAGGFAKRLEQGCRGGPLERRAASCPLLILLPAGRAVPGDTVRAAH